MRWIVLVLLVAMTRDAIAGDDGPPLEPGRIAGEALAGSVLGIAGAIGAGYALYRVERHTVDCDSFKHGCGWTGIFTGGIVGMTMLAPAGVGLVGSLGDQTGSWLAAYEGSAAGALAGFGLLLLENDLAIAIPIGSVAGSIIGWNLTRRYETKRETARWLPAVSASSERVEVGLVGRF